MHLLEVALRGIIPRIIQNYPSATGVDPYVLGYIEDFVLDYHPAVIHIVVLRNLLFGERHIFLEILYEKGNGKKKWV